MFGFGCAFVKPAVYSSIHLVNWLTILQLSLQFLLVVFVQALAGVFQELLARKEDFLRALRGLFREIVRVLRHDMDFGAFCLSLLNQDSPITRDEHGVKVGIKFCLMLQCTQP